MTSYPKKISLDNAKKEKLFYFVSTVVVYRESDKRCLILKRHEREKVHPGKYCVPGGKLEWEDFDIKKGKDGGGGVLYFDDAIKNLLKREVLEEAGVQIKKDIHYLADMVFIRPDETPVMLVRFAAKYKKGKVKFDPKDFSDFAWVNEKELKNYDCIGNVVDEVKDTIKHFKKG
ncbi:MAG: NUDIX domain-containing protein [Candidatus Paceibacterota bacterium]